MNPSPPFTPGQLYHRRNDLHSKYKGQERGGIITPASAPIILIVSGSSGQRHGYTDRWSNDGKVFYYYGEGQVGDMQFTKGNRALRDHEDNRKEIHLFEELPRKKGWLKYVGEMRCIDSRWVDGPDTNGKMRKAILFTLQPIQKPVSFPTSRLIVATTSEQVRRNIATFNAEANQASARAVSILHQTSYWVFDEESGLFGPSKFVGYSGMNFQLYERALHEETSGARFDGNVARLAAEAALDNSYTPSQDLENRLDAWANRLLGPGVFEGIDRSKWMFLRLPGTRSYWAAVANPSKYRINDAIRELEEDDWTVKDSNVRAGDRIAIWKARSRDAHRGVIAFAEVLSNPAVADVPPSRHAYYIDRELLKPSRRVNIRYLKPPNLPLWLDQKGNEKLGGLSVARASGGTIFKITPEQWLWLIDAAGSWPHREVVNEDDLMFAVAESRGNKRNGGQGFAVDPRTRKVVEQYAVDLATHHFEHEGFQIEVAGKPYDLHCKRAGEVLYVEVKGTQTPGDEILLTPNEVDFASKNSHQMALFVVRNISVSWNGDTPKANGGDVEIKQPWRPDPERLHPAGYIYKLEPKAMVAPESLVS